MECQNVEGRKDPKTYAFIPSHAMSFLVTPIIPIFPDTSFASFNWNNCINPVTALMEKTWERRGVFFSFLKFNF